MTRAIGSAVMLGILASSLGGCVRLGLYRAVSYDSYRPRVANERATIRTDASRPLQWVTAGEPGRLVQGIPVDIEVSSNGPATWETFADAFTLYEVIRKRNGRYVKVDTSSLLLVPYVRDSEAKLDEYPEILVASSFSAARSLSREILRTLPPPEENRTRTFFLICAAESPGEQCIEFGKRYEIHLAASAAGDLQQGTLLQQDPAIYPFQMERRSAPVTIIAGILLIVTFLTWAAG